MSKIKDESERIREIEFEQYVSFMEWVCDQEVSVDDTNEEEGPKEPPSKGRDFIVQKNTLKAANNSSYNPKIGA